MTVLEQLRKTIEDGHPGETEKMVREAIKRHYPPGRILDRSLTPCKRTVEEDSYTIEDGLSGETE